VQARSGRNENAACAVQLAQNRADTSGRMMRRWLTPTAAAAVVCMAAACSSSPSAAHATKPPTAAGGVAARASKAPAAIKVVATADWWTATIDQAPNCGPAALLRHAGRVERLGDCAGLLLVPPASLTLRVGERIDLHTGFSLPRSSDPAVLAQTTVSPDGRTGTYQALSPGHVTLISARSRCVGLKIKNEIKANCPVLAVTVLAR
jgi:hypothetical protein